VLAEVDVIPGETGHRTVKKATINEPATYRSKCSGIP
jgi:hypothetical protein